MLGRLKEFFAADEAVKLEVDQEGAATDRDLQIATTVLLVEMAAADQEIVGSEGAALVKLLAGQFNLPEEELTDLIQAAVTARQKVGRIDSFVGLLNERFSVAQRQKVLAMLWAVIMADGKIDKYEKRLATQMRFRFQLTEEQSAAARAEAEQGML